MVIFFSLVFLLSHFFPFLQGPFALLSEVISIHSQEARVFIHQFMNVNDFLEANKFVVQKGSTRIGAVSVTDIAGIIGAVNAAGIAGVFSAVSVQLLLPIQLPLRLRPPV